MGETPGPDSVWRDRGTLPEAGVCPPGRPTRTWAVSGGRHGLLATGSPLHLPIPTLFPWSRAGAGKISLGASGERKTERETIGRTLGSVQRLFRGKKRERRGCADRRGSRRQKAFHPCTGAVARCPFSVSRAFAFFGESGDSPVLLFFFLAVWLIARSI